MIETLPVTWASAKLSDVCQINPRGKSGLADDDEVTFVPMAAVSEFSGTIYSPEIRPLREVQKGFTPFQEGDVLFAKITPCMENGKAAIARNLVNRRGYGSTEFHVIRPTPLVLAEWIFAIIRTHEFRRAAASSFQGVVGQQRVTTSFLERFRIPLPPLSEQQYIVNILHEAEEIRSLRVQAESKTAELMPAMFHFAFSNLVTKDGTKLHRLDEIAHVQGGIQVSKARDNSPLKAPYLRVANVQRDSLDLREIKEIGLTETELERTRLQKGDILIVEGHGNASELGRAAIWTGEIDPCTHQNHLIRVRCKPGTDPAYVLSMLNSPLGRGHFLKTGKTTSGLNTISTGIVRSFRMPIPTVKAMEDFAAFREAALPLMFDAAKNSDLVAGSLNASLSAHAFSGQLTTNWREANKENLAIEARERDEALHQSQKRTVLLIANAGSTTKAFAAHIFQARTDGIHSDLNREQHFLLKEIDRMFAGVDYGRYFTAEKIADEVQGPLHRNPQGVLAHLQVFAARGLLVPVSRRRKDATGSPFAGCFRLPLKASEGRTFSGVEDIELPEQPGDDVRGELMKIQRRLATGAI